MSKVRCADCQYRCDNRKGDVWPLLDDSFWCYRFPNWKLVDADHYCGEFKIKNEKSEK